MPLSKATFFVVVLVALCALRPARAGADEDDDEPTVATAEAFASSTSNVFIYNGQPISPEQAQLLIESGLLTNPEATTETDANTGNR